MKTQIRSLRLSNSTRTLQFHRLVRARAQSALAFVVALSLVRSPLGIAQISPATLPDLKLSTAGSVSLIALQDDGKVIICGSFDSVNNVPRTNLARLNPNGTVDLTWIPKISGPVLAIV